MSNRHFGVGLVHGVVATRSAARLPIIADAFNEAEVISAATGRHALLISIVPQHFRGDVEADRLFSDPERIPILAMAHHLILQAATAVTDVVPIRLGTLVSGPAGARDLLTREASRFADHLAAIRNSLEFAVRILPARGPARQALPIAASNGRQYLRARRDERTRGRPASLISRCGNSPSEPLGYASNIEAHDRRAARRPSPTPLSWSIAASSRHSPNVPGGSSGRSPRIILPSICSDLCRPIASSTAVRRITDDLPT